MLGGRRAMDMDIEVFDTQDLFTSHKRALTLDSPVFSLGLPTHPFLRRLPVVKVPSMSPP